MESCFTIEELADTIEVDLTQLEKFLDVTAAKKKAIQVYMKKEVTPDKIAKTLSLNEVQVKYHIIQHKLSQIIAANNAQSNFSTLFDSEVS